MNKHLANVIIGLTCTGVFFYGAVTNPDNYIKAFFMMLTAVGVSMTIHILKAGSDTQQPAPPAEADG